jgi:hypothetical protein
MIKSIVSALRTATSLPVFPFATDGLKECVVYEWTPLSDDGAKETAQLMVRIKARDMATAEAKAAAVRSALISIGDNKNNKAWCKQNGGGTLRNEDTGFIDWIMYFDLVYQRGL